MAHQALTRPGPCCLVGFGGRGRAGRRGPDYTPGALLPVLHVDDATKELPKLTEAHAWAHVQITGGLPATAADFETLLTGRARARPLPAGLPPAAAARRPATWPAWCRSSRPECWRGSASRSPGSKPPISRTTAPNRDRSTCPSTYWSFTTAAGAGFERTGPTAGGPVRRRAAGSRTTHPGPERSRLRRRRHRQARASPSVVRCGCLIRAPAGADQDLRDRDRRHCQPDRRSRPAALRPLAGGRRQGSRTPGAARLGPRELNTRAPAPGCRRPRCAGRAGRAGGPDGRRMGTARRRPASQPAAPPRPARAGGRAGHTRTGISPRSAPTPCCRLAGPALARIRSADPTTTLHGVLRRAACPMVTLDACFRRHHQATRAAGPASPPRAPTCRAASTSRFCWSNLISGDPPADPDPSGRAGDRAGQRRADAPLSQP